MSEPDPLVRRDLQILADAVAALDTVWDRISQDLPPEEAAALRQKLRDLAPRLEAGDEPAGAELVLAVREHERLRKWLWDVRRRWREDAQKMAGEARGVGEPLPGPPALFPRPIYCCPHPGCTFRWPQRFADQQPPPCPLHGKTLHRCGEEGRT